VIGNVTRVPRGVAPMSCTGAVFKRSVISKRDRIGASWLRGAWPSSSLTIRPRRNNVMQLRRTTSDVRRHCC
jgi:hypothetical protein